MRVRVVPVREQRWLSWMLGGLGAAALIGVVMNSSPHGAALVEVGIAGMVWMVGLLVSPRRKPYVADVTSTVNGVRIGNETLGGYVEASVVPAKAGASVALITPDDQMFIETASMDDANQLAVMTRAEIVDEFWLPRPHPAVRSLKVAFAWFGILASLAVAAVDYEKAIFGVVVVCGIIASLLHLIDQTLGARVLVAKGKGLEGAEGAVRDHVLLHTLRLEPEKDEPRVRIQVLDRNDEPRDKWLARLDALTNDTYRGALPSQAELRAVLEDRQAALDDRLAAARLLVRRYGVDIADIYAQVEDEAPWFFEIASDDTSSVAASLERALPRFRA